MRQYFSAQISGEKFWCSLRLDQSVLRQMTVAVTSIPLPLLELEPEAANCQDFPKPPPNASQPNASLLLPAEIYLPAISSQGVWCAMLHHSPFLLSPEIHLWCGWQAGSHHTRCREKAVKASFSQDSQAISGRWLMVINGKWRFSLWSFTVRYS